MTSPIVSVVMSVYNAEKFLPQAIKSILNQSFSNFEFIIIEDCSTDNSLAIIQDFARKDSRIKLIQKSKNKRMAGFIENLNIGLSEAKGKYIARMDADDISHPHRFEKQVKFLEENPDIFMVGSAINFIDENNQFTKKLEAIEDNQGITQTMPKKITMYHPVIMFRNDGKTRYREKIFYCEDYDLYLRLILEGKKFYNFTEPLLDYRILDSSISRKDGNFMRTLFVEKMKTFYLENKTKGKDSYDEFAPSDLLHILDKNTNSSKKNLTFALNVATKFSYKNEFSTILEKYNASYSSNSKIFILRILNTLPNIFSKIYFKLSNG